MLSYFVNGVLGPEFVFLVAHLGEASPTTVAVIFMKIINMIFSCWILCSLNVNPVDLSLLSFYLSPSP